VQEDRLFYATTHESTVGEALRMKHVAGSRYEGYFNRHEIERYYIKRGMVRIQGHWLRDHGRTCDDKYIEASTEDPQVAEALEMAPWYELIRTEFGIREGDKIERYQDLFPIAAIEETSWYEEPEAVPTYEDCM